MFASPRFSTTRYLLFKVAKTISPAEGKYGKLSLDIRTCTPCTPTMKTGVALKWNRPEQPPFATILPWCHSTILKKSSCRIYAMYYTIGCCGGIEHKGLGITAPKTTSSILSKPHKMQTIIMPKVYLLCIIVVAVIRCNGKENRELTGRARLYFWLISGATRNDNCNQVASRPSQIHVGT